MSRPFLRNTVIDTVYGGITTLPGILAGGALGGLPGATVGAALSALGMYGQALHDNISYKAHMPRTLPFLGGALALGGGLVFAFAQAVSPAAAAQGPAPCKDAAPMTAPPAPGK